MALLRPRQLVAFSSDWRQFFSSHHNSRWSSLRLRSSNSALQYPSATILRASIHGSYRPISQHLSLAASFAGSRRFSSASTTSGDIVSLSTSSLAGSNQVIWPDLPIFRACISSSNALAIRHVGADSDGGCESTYTYGQLLHLSAMLSGAISAHVDSTHFNQYSDDASVLCGSRVVLLLPASVEFVCGLLAVWAQNGVVVPLHASLAIPQMKFMIEDAQASLVLVNPTLMQSHGLQLQKELPHIKFVQIQVKDGDNNNASDTSAHAANAGRAHLESSNANSIRRTSIDGTTKPKHTVSFRNVALAQLAALIYSSGTTGRPKGVAYSHSMFVSQVNSLLNAWKWTEKDAILHCLPLHHVHGLVNALLCPLSVGAAVHFLKKFDAESVITEWLRLNSFTVFTGVPTMYQKLVSAYDALPAEAQSRLSQRLNSFRLMMCGSAALPEPLFQRWLKISGQRLLERYGSTECGMVLANPYEPQSRRKMGAVGQPLPNVQVKVNAMPESDGHTSQSLANFTATAGTESAAGASNTDRRQSSGSAMNVVIPASVSVGVRFGELCVRGSSVFPFYWRRVDATAAAFDASGYFLTGDIVRIDSDGDYRIVGRASVDIIKSGGNKLSALEIESVLLQHPNIAECAVIGWPDQQFGEVVCLVAVTDQHKHNGSESGNVSVSGSGSGSVIGIGLSLLELQSWCRGRLSASEIPRRLYVLDALPRNALGKVNKKELRAFITDMQPNTVATGVDKSKS